MLSSEPSADAAAAAAAARGGCGGCLRRLWAWARASRWKAAAYALSLGALGAYVLLDAELSRRQHRGSIAPLTCLVVLALDVLWASLLQWGRLVPAQSVCAIIVVARARPRARFL